MNRLRPDAASPREEKYIRIEKITRHGKEFAVLLLIHELKKLMDDAEMFADVRAYDAAKARIERGGDDLIRLEITERRLAGENPLKVWLGGPKFRHSLLVEGPHAKHFDDAPVLDDLIDQSVPNIDAAGVRAT